MGRPWQDIDTLERLYYDERLSQPEIAERLDCSRWTVRKWMERHGIETRDRLEGRMLWHRRQPEVPVRTHTQGYEYATHEYQGEANQAYIHRLLAVSEFGFDAVKGMHVHHKNHIPWDNRPENIELMKPGEHKTHHLNIEHGNEPMPEV